MSAGAAVATVLCLACFQSSNGPEMPIVRDGCTMECCGYGTWITPSTTLAMREPRNDAETAFTLGAGDSVTALEGQVHTIRPGRVVFTGRHTFQAVGRGTADSMSRELMVPAGDTVFVTGIAPEATDARIWYRGREYAIASGLNVFSVSRPTADAPYDVVSLPLTQWWVKVRNRRSSVGWVRDPNRFVGAGRCR